MGERRESNPKMPLAPTLTTTPLKEEEFQFRLLLLKSDFDFSPLVSRLSPTHFRSHKAKLLGEDYPT